MWDRNSFYHALKLGFRKRHSSGFSYQVSYQFQKSIDEGSTLAGSPRETFNDQWQGNNWLDHRIDRGPSNFNLPNVFSSNFSVDLPFGRGRTYGAGATGFVGKLIEGWAVNGILNLSDGAPQNILGPDRVLCTSNCAQSRPSLVAGGNNNPITGDPNAWFGDPEENFELPAPGRFGNLGRNTGVGPGIAQVDFSIHKRFYVGEAADIQFRAEFFNVFNRTNFQGPVRSRGAFTSGGGVNGTFGELTETGTTSRQIQLALKINF